MSSLNRIRAVRKAIVVVLCYLIVQAPCLAIDEAVPLRAATTGNEFSDRYTGLTKKILLAGIEVERFSLNYRLENAHISNFKKLVFFGTQQAGSSCGLAFEIVADKQFNRGRHRLLSLNVRALQQALRTAEVGSIIAASGSAFELAANAVQYERSRRRGFDTASANRFVASHLQQIDTLLSEREALVAANPLHPAHDRAVIEGKILQSMRGTFVNEYAHFSADNRSAFAVQNLFYLLNVAYNTVGACGAGVAYTSTKIGHLKLNGPANVLFIVSGAMAGATPLLCTAQLWAQRKFILGSQQRKFGGSDADLAEISKERALLEAASTDPGSLMPSFPSTQRLALYTESDKLFTKQLESETTTMQQLNKIALQNSFAGPAIGSLLMTQGILGKVGFDEYFPRRPKKQFNLDYKGAVCGTVGTSMAVVGNAAWFLASMSYEHRLKKQNRLPEQLIKERLAHLDDLEKTVTAL